MKSGVDMRPAPQLFSRRSGCSEPNGREKTTSKFRFRLSKVVSNGGSPRSWSSLPTGIVTTPGESLTWRLYLPEPRMYALGPGYKIKANASVVGSPRKTSKSRGRSGKTTLNKRPGGLLLIPQSSVRLAGGRGVSSSGSFPSVVFSLSFLSPPHLELSTREFYD